MKLAEILGNTRSLIVLAVLALAMGLTSRAGAVDLEIENDADYARLVDAMRAAEYVRSDVIVASNPKPRVYATLAATMAYAERNPYASDDQINAFLIAFDSALSGYAPGDPDLNSKACFYAALRFALVDDAALAGTDTDVGRRALALLGIVVPDPDGFESIQRRMVRYELALARPLDYRNEVFDLLVTGFYGVDLNGNARGTLAALLDSYFAGAGFDPALGAVRADMATVNAGLAILPADYAGYQLAISEGDENTALRDAVTAQLDTVRAQIDSIVGSDPMVDDGSLDDALANAPGIAQSVDLAMNDPAYVQQVLDDLRAELEATAEARAAASAATFLMLQSDFADIEAYATYTRDYSEIALETNDTLAYVQSGVSIAGNLAIGVAAVYTGNPFVAASAFLNVATESVGLIDDLTGPPSVEQQTFDQVVALRQQVEEMRQEMTARFDRIDRQLNVMYTTMITGFNQIGDQIGDLQGDVEAIARDMAVVRSQLRHLEAALYGVAQDILLSDLTNETNVVLDYRDENGIDLPYSGGSPDFITASESFFTYATLTALSEAFAGSRSNPTVTISNAEEYIGDGPVSGYLNDLAVLTTALGVPSLSGVDLVGLEPWSQAASAYAQLARENPWYFAYRYNRQLEDYNADPDNESLPELDRILVSGDQVMAFIENIREIDTGGNAVLFDALVLHYKDAAAAFQAQLDAEIAGALPAVFSNNGKMLDLWMGEVQADIGDVVTDPGLFVLANVSGNLTIPDDATNMGYNAFTDANDDARARILQVWHLLQKGKAPDPGAYRFRAEIFWFSPDYSILMWIGDTPTYPFDDPDAAPEFASKRYDFSADFFAGFSWFPIFNDEPGASNAFGDVWHETRSYSGYSRDMDTQVSNQLNEPRNNEQFRSDDFRITFASNSADTLIEESELYGDLYDFRIIARDALLLELIDEDSDLAIAARALDRAEAILDAYVTIGMPDELNASDVLRSALRALPGTSDLGLGSIDVIKLIDEMGLEDGGGTWADQSFNVTLIDEILNERIDVVHTEILRGLQRPAAAPDYVGWVQRELANLRDTAFDLARDDMYVAGANGTVVTDVFGGVLVNDVDQEFRTITLDTAYILDPGYVAPSNGTVLLNADGSFTYKADPGFSGTDSFTYRSMTTITGVAEPVYSSPATVVIQIPDAGCGLADFNADGELNFFDVSEFLVAYQAQDPQADLNDDGLFNFFDVSAFLVAFGAGCP
ncbi:MAG: hypothetical protein JJ916_11785 [Phycisphaerales bacterium]|nr:hypothetical protein [Phycisphaerales bacterium]